VYTWAQVERTRSDEDEENRHAEQDAALKGGQATDQDVIADIVFSRRSPRAREFMCWQT